MNKITITAHSISEEHWKIILALPDGDYSIKKYHRNRSNDQNEYYWGVVLDILKDTGYSAEELHEIFKYKFLKSNIKHHYIVRSTTDLTTKEFEEYLENIRRFASSELGIYIPEPNEPQLPTNN